MKLSLRSLLTGSLVALTLSLSVVALSYAQDSQEIDLIAHRVQIIHNGAGADVANFNITFTNFGEGGCDAGDDDAIASGIEVRLSPSSCVSICARNALCIVDGIVLFPFVYDIDPFVPHTVNHKSYGTFFGLNPPAMGPGTVSARIGALLPEPVGGCGTWNLNVQATGLDLSSITSNPMSIWLNDEDDSGPFCFDVNDAIIGPPINPHPPVLRRTRRQ